MTTKRTSLSENDQKMLDWTLSCRDEAEDAKRDRMWTNKRNWDSYHMRHDFSHKQKGQSREVLAKQPMAVEQIASFFQQALIDLGDWSSTQAYNEKKETLMKIRPNEIHKITQRQLEKADFFGHVGVGIKSGLIGALIITKVGGEFVTKPKFVVKKKKTKKQTEKVVVKTEDKSWQLKLDLVRQENYYPDPTGEGLYEVCDEWMDFYKVKELSEGPDAIYSKKAVENLSRTLTETESDIDSKARETNQNEHNRSGHRGRVKITELWGKVLDRDTGELLHDNIVITVGNDTEILRGPMPNPHWHQESPFVVAPLMDVPNAVWPKALMDSPTAMNRMLNEIYNLIVDGAMKAVNAISQIRVDGLVDQSQIADGIPAGTALKINSKIPHGTKVAEPVITADVPADALNVMNLVQQEFNAAALTSDARSGAASVKEQSATAIVESSQTITSVFQGLAKNVEQRWIKKILGKSWKLTAQNMDALDQEELKVLVGDEEYAQIEDSSPQEIFVSTVNGVKFNVFGIAETMQMQQDFRKWTTLLQTISSSEILIEAFVQKYDFTKFVGEIMTSLGIKKAKIERPEIEQMGDTDPEEQIGEEAQPGATPDIGSQLPDPNGIPLSSLLGETAQQQGGIPQASFPPSRAGTGQ
jgi:hypothetical protein